MLSLDSTKEFFNKNKKYKWIALAVAILLALIIIPRIDFSKNFDLEIYYACLESGEYNKAYDLLSDSSKKSYAKDVFVDFHKNTLGKMPITDIVVDNSARFARGASSYISCDVTYKTKNLGDYKESFTLSVTEDYSKLNWQPDTLFKGIEITDSVRETATTGKRGEIFSADDVLLAGNGYGISIVAQPSRIPDVEIYKQQLSPLIGMTPDQIQQKLDSKEAKRDGMVVLTYFFPNEYDETLTPKIDAIIGVIIDRKTYTPIRVYPMAAKGVNLSHTLGYVSLVTKEDLDANSNLKAGQMIGKSGIEKQYDEILQPQSGYEIFISTSDKRKKTVLYKTEAKNGQDVKLTINSQTQTRVEQSMKANIPSTQRGVSIVMDSKTGAVEAISSFPNYSPYLFSKPIPEATWASLNDKNNGLPLFDRATMGLYPPGSTTKPFTAAIAFDNNIVGSDYVFTGQVANNKWRPDIKGWVYPAITRYQSYPGPMNFTNTMAYSDNIYYADLAMKTGYDTFVQNLGTKFGFMDKVPYALPIAKSQLVNDGTEMNIKLLADTGYGQGEFLTTPLQLASSYTALTNNGDILVPQIVQGIYETVGKDQVAVKTFEKEVWKPATITEESIKNIHKALNEATQSGTANALYMKDLPTYGKTGTSEVGPQKEIEISWYVGYTKKEGVEKIILTMIECKPREGSYTKIHITKDIMLGLIGKPMQKPTGIVVQEKVE